MDKNKRVQAEEQNSKDRLWNFDEVAYGYTKDEAMEEASRCLNCKTRPCVNGCPVNNDIPEFIGKIASGDIEEAYNILKAKNNFPAVCGRVCPQEDQCEGNCIRGKKGEPLSIGLLERFCADYSLDNDCHCEERSNLSFEKTKKDKSVAVIGSGPAGLACARDLAEMGYGVVVYEALDVLGGIMTYGIPKFRLPHNIVEREIDYMKSLGVEFVRDYRIGQKGSLDELYNRGFKAVFMATGANKPRKLEVESEDLRNIYSAYEYLLKINLLGKDSGLYVGKNVVIVGGGNVAIDAARVSKRLGADKVVIVYRRTLNEMPARKDEIHHAEEEGIEFMMLTNPVKFIGQDDKVMKVECIKMELGELDESGRGKPHELKDSKFFIDADTVVVAVGQLHDHDIMTEKDVNIKVRDNGGIIVHTETMETTKEGLFAGGDVVSGGSTVIDAIKSGKKAAKAIHEKLR